MAKNSTFIKLDDPETVPLTNIYGHTFLLDGEGRVDL